MAADCRRAKRVNLGEMTPSAADTERTSAITVSQATLTVSELEAQLAAIEADL